MYHFAIIALLGLATLKVVDLLEGFVPQLTRIHALLTFGLAVAATVAIDYSVFDGFGVTVRESWMGTWATGLMVGSMTTVWRAVFGWLGASESSPGESARSGRPRVAA
jgi:hypothetical protein